jgi:hypothetical protein
MSIEKILKIIKIAIAAGLITGVDEAKLKAIVEILSLIAEKEV